MFPIPRRQGFPLPLGDNSPHTPADPEPAWPPYKPPNAEDYRLARQRWEETGELAALWEMQDNVGEKPWPPSPAMSMMRAAATGAWSVATIMEAGERAAREAHQKQVRRAVAGFVLVVAGWVFFLVAVKVFL